MTSPMPRTDRQPARRLHIDWTRCDGRGLCTELLPTVLDRDDWGYPLPRNGSREPTIPAALDDDARTAIDLCPRLALTLTLQHPAIQPNT